MAHTARSNTSVPTMASNVDTTVSLRVPYQEKSFQCTKEDCQHFFDTLEAMKQHKKYDPDHYYCKKCDFDAEDWEDLTHHKVENMAPYIEGVAGRVKPLDDDLKHITCEFCGEDFKSFGGRKRHRQQNHPADQDITCPGCFGKFVRASHLIEHLERDHCDIIPAHKFHAEMQHKYVVGQIMAAPDRAFQPPRMLGGKPSVERITDGGETIDQDYGGVSLMDQQDEAQLGGHKPMKAEKNLIDLNAQPNHEPWPRISTKGPVDLAESLHSMSVDSQSTPLSNKSSGGVSLGGLTGRRKGEKLYTESYPDLDSPSTGSVIEQRDNDTASVSTIAASSTVGRRGAWGTSSTSRALFPGAKVTPKVRPKAGDWDAILAQHAEESGSSTGADMLKLAWWNPDSEDYDIARFRHPVYEAFFCPFPACEDAMFGNSFDCQSDIENHIKYCHTRTKFRCDGCSKFFQSAFAVVAHVESTRKCGIRGSDSFGKFLSDITGGFLKSKYVGEPRIYRAETALVKQGQPTGGIASTRFTAKEPRG